ncbi:MAG: cob(I)yrinic acid a,c-diamide adenosyltransferase [Candidatus Peregrinibacteria bacterium]|nr:cob(I)yrinic acid a,c-diamide adenosyltransferase [Candidatus Peregrinibacteria bacterium]
MILIITGNGKGKTTSALGTALRASGWEKRVAIAFFDKGGSHYGEQNILESLQEKIHILRFGLPRFDETKKTFRFDNTDEDIAEARRGVEEVVQLFSQNYFLVVCDEIINCLNLGLVDRGQFESLLEACPKETHLILTGRNVPDWLKERADLVSEVNEVKHYFRKGSSAIKGLDY